jgi:hypothetical protein
MEPSHYEEIPKHIADKILDKNVNKWYGA